METASRSTTLVRFGKTVLCMEQISAMYDKPSATFPLPPGSPSRPRDKNGPIRVILDNGKSVDLYDEDAAAARKLMGRIVSVDEMLPVLEALYKAIGIRK